MCTYYLGIVNDAFISSENWQIDSNTKVCLLDEYGTTLEKDYYTHHEHPDLGPIDFYSDNQHLNLPIIPATITVPKINKNSTDEDVYFYLFSRPPPLLIL